MNKYIQLIRKGEYTSNNTKQKSNLDEKQTNQEYLINILIVWFCFEVWFSTFENRDCAVSDSNARPPEEVRAVSIIR